MRTGIIRPRMAAVILPLIAAMGCNTVHEPAEAGEHNRHDDAGDGPDDRFDGSTIDASPSGGQSQIQALCERLRTESACAAATVACGEYGLDAPLPHTMIDCGTSLSDGELSEHALECVLRASAEEQPFMLV